MSRMVNITSVSLNLSRNIHRTYLFLPNKFIHKNFLRQFNLKKYISLLPGQLISLPFIKHNKVDDRLKLRL